MHGAGAKKGHESQGFERDMVVEHAHYTNSNGENDLGGEDYIDQGFICPIISRSKHWAIRQA